MWASAEFIQKPCRTSELSSNVIWEMNFAMDYILCIMNFFEVLSSQSSQAASEVMEYSDKDLAGEGSRFTFWLCHFNYLVLDKLLNFTTNIY